ncbi:hypothetical protein HPULCUR_005466 [Helicostylum pulchrum]|uniref:Uncharacterized protein n=1 Tax=Helicostylum pulchrum TaxID=562976 RepID=A0ABP9XZ56_9FUNG
MSALFSKELPQSSLQSQESDQSLLCLEKFINPPRTLYDEIGQQEQDFYTSLKSAQENSDLDWKSLVYKLQVENTNLVCSLQEANQDLLQSRREKQELQQFIQQQTETASRLRSVIENQKQQLKIVDNNKQLDLIFQKKFLTMENQALKESQREVNEYYGIQLNTTNHDPLLKWRSCVQALIAIQRFQKKKS